MTEHGKLLILALRAAVTGETFAPIAVDWKAFAALTRAHKVEAMVFDGLQKVPQQWQLLPEGLQKHLTETYMRAIYQDAQSEHRMQLLKQALENAGVRHIFLKGAVLKYDYPVPALRTMCDLDVLVHTEDYPAIDKIAEAMEGTLLPGDGNHRNYGFPGGVAVEFHPNLLHHETPVGTGINPGWQYARPDAPDALTEEGIYLNTLCHLANHFVAGGVGARFVLDVWVSRHLRKTQPDRAFVERELERFGLLKFAENVEALAEAWFGCGQKDAVLEELEAYILSSGSFGNAEQAMLNAMSFAGSRSATLWKKAFYSRQELEDRFPWCKGKPILLPAAWCVRAYKAVTIHGRHIVHWSRKTADISDEQVRKQQQKLQRLGIQIK